MERILERSLKKLRKACSSRSDKDLIEAIKNCQSTLSSDESNSNAKKRADSIGIGLADSCFEPYVFFNPHTINTLNQAIMHTYVTLELQVSHRVRKTKREDEGGSSGRVGEIDCAWILERW